MPKRPGRARRGLAAFLIVVLSGSACASEDGSNDAFTDGDAAEGDDTGTSCRPEETLCNATCINLDTSHENCGACGHACQAVAVCYMGECLLECPAGFDDCGGGCVDVESDPANCGTCGHACDPDPPHASPECVAGLCEILCDPEWSDNNGIASDGCESLCEISSPTEVCNGEDDNCDGNVDEGFECRQGRVESCPTTCSSTGTKECTSSCTWGSCEPPDELCDAVDHDCDGLAYNVSLPFSDVSDNNPCIPYIWAVYNAGIMSGITSTRFDPAGTMLRAQIALAIQRALGISPNGTYQASEICDLNDVSAESGMAILALFDHSITSGKTSDCLVGGTCMTATYHYCPIDGVTRNELGVLLWRADDPGSTMDCPTCPSSTYFCDSAEGTGCGCIEALSDELPSKSSCSAGSTCSGTAYCPADSVTRCEAATALANLFSLDLPPACM